MTNKEKAREFSDIFWCHDATRADIEECCEEMAEWKDNQFLEFLENEKNSHQLTYRDDWKSFENDIYHSFLDELIRKFKSKKEM